VLHSGTFRPNPQTFDYVGKACHGQNYSLLQKFLNYVQKSFKTLALGLIFFGKTKSLPKRGCLKGAPLRQVPKCLTNVRLGWKGLPRTTALAYLKNKRFNTLATSVNV
jgi:hypothetical protein